MTWAEVALSADCRIFTLYVKIHRITGLRYLGQTSNEPGAYKGSGIDWKRHLREHGRHFDTQVLIRTSDWEELKYWGRHYSTLWNIVTAADDFGNRIWANRIPETGGGGYMTSDIATEIQNRPEVRKKSSEDMAARMKNPEFKAMVVAALTSDESKARSLASRSTQESKKRHKDALTKAMNEPAYLASVSGLNHHRSDHTVYEFVHVSGLTLRLKKQELARMYNLCPSKLGRLIKGARGIHKGWTYGPYNKSR